MIWIILALTLNKEQMGEYVEMESRKRSEKNRHLTYSLPDFFREYKKECKVQYGKGFTKRMLPRNVFMSVLKMYLIMLAKKIIVSRSPFRMPRRLGIFKVIKRECIRGEKQERRIGFVKINDKNKEKMNYYLKNHYMGSCYFLFRWRKFHSRGTMRFVGWYSFRPVKSLKKFLSDYVFECSKDPYIPDYDVELESNKPARNPLELPAP